MTLPTYWFRRLGTIMSPDPDDPIEFWGAFNPTIGRSPDGAWHLLVRVTAEGNVSRLRIVDLQLDGDVPVGVRRGDVVLAPDEPWERGGGRGGIEDPRATWVPALQAHVMTYTAQGAYGARPALAVSEDLRTWRRLGPLHFAYEPALAHDLNAFPNKDVVLFPEPVRAPDGRLSYAFLHRPMWDPALGLPAGVADARHSIWVSFVAVDAVAADLAALVLLDQHRPVAQPRYPFESTKIGAGPPPIRVPEGWLLVHHGVSEHDVGEAVPRLDYAAGAMILDGEDVTRVLYRTAEPVLAPQTAKEQAGIDRHIVFPSALARIGETHYLFYGVSDRYIGVARLERADDGASARSPWRLADDPVAEDQARDEWAAEEQVAEV
jgi:beta-1,2-mannobiose phosphorylase / 1,2-beta-oligomannan phosphorylase